MVDLQLTLLIVHYGKQLNYSLVSYHAARDELEMLQLPQHLVLQ